MIKSTPAWKKYTTAGFVVVTNISYAFDSGWKSSASKNSKPLNKYLSFFIAKFFVACILPWITSPEWSERRCPIVVFPQPLTPIRTNRISVLRQRVVWKDDQEHHEVVNGKKATFAHVFFNQSDCTKYCCPIVVRAVSDLKMTTFWWIVNSDKEIWNATVTLSDKCSIGHFRGPFDMWL